MNDKYVEKLKDLIRAVAEGASHDVRVFHYSDPKDFKALWGLNDKDGDEALADRLSKWGCQPDGPGATIVVVWDGSPDDDPHQLSVGEFVTPYDWAKIASHCIYSESDLEDCQLRFLILDARPKPDCGRAADSCATPWIQGYLGVARTESTAKLRDAAEKNRGRESMFALVRHWWRARGRESMFALVRHWWHRGRENTFPLIRHRCPMGDFSVLLEDIADPRRVLTTRHQDHGSGGLRSIEDMMERWRMNLQHEKNRHSAANLIGPVLLSAALPQNTANQIQRPITHASVARRALVVAMKQVGLWPATASAPGGQYQGFLRSKEMHGLCQDDIFDRLRKIRFCLVDDKFDLGYDRFLAPVVLGHNFKSGVAGNARKFSNAYGHSLLCERTIDGLLAYLLKHHSAGGRPIENWHEPRIFDYADVLLLDLRLWSNRGERQEVLGKIVKATDKMLGGTPADQVDPDLATALEAARSVVGKGGTRGFDFASLALLPLLLTCIDRTLPIIVFSSTQQRRVTDLFRGKPNIFTGFAKPLAGRAADDALRQLVQSLCDAVMLHELRAAWSKATRLQPVQKTFDYELFPAGGHCQQTVNFGANTTAVEVRARIGQLFAWCIDDRLPFWEIDKPWDLLEELAMRRMPPGWTLVGFDNDCGLMSRAARALKLNRNARVHGKLYSRGFESIHRHRQVLALQLLFLIEYLNPPPNRGHAVAAPALGVEPARREVAKYIVWNLIRELQGQGGIGGWQLAPLSVDVLRATSRMWNAL